MNVKGLVGLAIVALAALPCAPCFAAEQPARATGEPVVAIDAESATHREVEPLGIKFQSLTALRLHPNGHLLACDGPAKQIKVIDSAGKQVTTIKLKFAPEAIDIAADGTMYCGGEGKLAKLNKEGNVLKTVPFPTSGTSPAAPQRRARVRQPRISGIAVSDKDVFVACGTGWSMGSKSNLFRFDLDLANEKLVAQDLRGCCQRCDIVVRDGKLYLAENTAHRVIRFDRDGKVLHKWGARSRTDLSGFGSCCNPMNLCFGSGGALYTAESGLGRVKRDLADGDFLGLVGYMGVQRFSRAGGLAAACSNIAIAVTSDGKRVYVMDYQNKLIRVLEEKD